MVCDSSHDSIRTCMSDSLNFNVAFTFKTQFVLHCELKNDFYQDSPVAVQIKIHGMVMKATIVYLISDKSFNKELSVS